MGKLREEVSALELAQRLVKSGDLLVPEQARAEPVAQETQPHQRIERVARVQPSLVHVQVPGVDAVETRERLPRASEICPLEYVQLKLPEVDLRSSSQDPLVQVSQRRGVVGELEQSGDRHQHMRRRSRRRRDGRDAVACRQAEKLGLARRNDGFETRARPVRSARRSRATCPREVTLRRPPVPLRI